MTFCHSLDRKKALSLLEELVWVRDRLRPEYQLDKNTQYNKLIEQLREYLGSTP